jgi:hypothetical protein
MATKVEPRVYHQQEVCAMLKTSRTSLLRMERRGILHPIRIHGRPLYIREEIDRLLTLDETPAPPPDYVAPE